MALDDTRAGEFRIILVLKLVNVWKGAFDALESDGTSGIQQVGEQKPCPGVPGFAEGNNKDVIGSAWNRSFRRLIAAEQVTQVHLNRPFPTKRTQSWRNSETGRGVVFHEVLRSAMDPRRYWRIT
jgi:hypothetical protein